MPRWVYKRLFIFTLPCMNRKKRLFHKPKVFLLQKTFLKALKSCFFTHKSFSFAQTFPYHHSKQPFSTLRYQFPPSHNLLSAKNKALLLMFALTPYAVTPKRRTDSKPFRRRFVRKTGFGSCRRKTLLKSSSTEL